MKLKIFLLLFSFLVLFLLYQKSAKSRAKTASLQELEEVTHITLEGEEGYCDVERWIDLRIAYKKIRKPKKKGEHFRLAEFALIHPPLSEAFLEKTHSPPQWMVEQIEEEFSSYSPFSLQMLTDMLKTFQEVPNWQEHYLLAKYKIYQGRVYLKDHSKCHHDLKYISAALSRLAKSVYLPDMEFLLTFHDSYDLEEIPVPLLVFSKKKSNKYMVMIPDPEMLTGYQEFDTSIDQRGESTPWETKKEIGFWRGSTTSGDFTQPNWRAFPRSRLVYLSLDYPQEVDARFSNLVQGAQSNRDFLKQSELVGEFVLPEDSLKYKYLIDIDGNASSFSHFYWLLRSNCVPFKQASSFIQWYYRALKPYKHYIPIREDLEDLPFQINWARTHDDEAKQIAQASTHFVKDQLTLEDSYLYFYLVLKKYGSLQQ